MVANSQLGGKNGEMPDRMVREDSKRLLASAFFFIARGVCRKWKLKHQSDPVDLKAAVSRCLQGT